MPLKYRWYSAFIVLISLLPFYAAFAQTPASVSPTLVLRLGHAGGASAIAYAPDSKTIASAGADGDVFLWNAETGQRFQTMRAQETNPLALAFAPDGKTLAVADLFGTIHLWNARSGKMFQSLKPDKSRFHGATVLVFSPDSTLLATAGQNTPVTFWDTQTGQVKQTLADQTDAQTLDFSADGNVLMVGEDRAAAAWFNVATGKIDHPSPRNDLQAAAAAAPRGGQVAYREMERQDVEFRGRVMPGRRILSTTCFSGTRSPMPSFVHPKWMALYPTCNILPKGKPWRASRMDYE